MLGTEYAKKRGGDALNNCWMVEVMPQSYEDFDMMKNTYVYSDPHKEMPSFPFVFCQDRAMLGGGVGFSIPQENIDKFPTITNRVNLTFYMNKEHKDWERVKKSGDYKHNDLESAMLDEIQDVDNQQLIKLEDTREGWCVALREVIDAHWAGEDISLVLDMSNIREYDAPIKGFGGTASGVLPLIIGLNDINSVLNTRRQDNLRSTDALDIMNLIGKIVVSGNVRRTALIALGNATDDDYVNAKNYKRVLPVLELDEYGYPKWEPKEDGIGMTQVRKPYETCVEELGKDKADELIDLTWRQENHRWASNNSILTDELFDDFHFVTAGIIANGEPGIVNLWLSQNYGRIIDGFQEMIDGDTAGTNPCAEISLANGENCNLVEYMPHICKAKGYNIDRIIEICTQYSYRITFAEYMWPITRHIVERNRRIGVSIGGIQDYYLSEYDGYAVEGFENDDITKPIFKQEILDELDHWYKVVKTTNKKHAKALNANESIKVTTVKPSGSISKLPGVSAGIHFHYAPYMIQRIRFGENDPNLDVLAYCGYPMEDDFKTPNTVVVEFPIKSPNADHPNFKCTDDFSLEEQLANQYLFAYAWADNAVSATITFKPEEHNKIEPLLRAYKDKLKTTSMLPYSGHGYTQAPWEPITKEEYEERIKKIDTPLHEAYKLIKLVGDSDLLDEECESGMCPIR